MATARQLFDNVLLDAADKCWPWLGYRNKQDYGVIRRPSQELAHRVSYALHNGTIQSGAVIRHSCDNPPCVNPSHLLIGTQADNVADMVAKQRHIDGHKSSAEKRRARTHCKNGHAYAEVGFYTYVYRGGRDCKKCISLRGEKQYQAKKRVR